MGIFNIQTKVTLESFLLWKKRKIEEKKATDLKNEEKKRKDFSSGKQFGISGREMFAFNPDLVFDNSTEDGEAAFDDYGRNEEEEDNIAYREIDFSALSYGVTDVSFFIIKLFKLQNNPNYQNKNKYTSYSKTYQTFSTKFLLISRSLL